MGLLWSARHRWIWIAVLLILFGCSGQMASPLVDAHQSASKESSRPRPETLPTSVSIAGCRVEAIHSYYWRDWMPIVGRPGPDGGTPLYTLLRFRFHNTTSHPRRFNISAVIHDGTGAEHPVPFRIMRSQGSRWSGELAAGAQQEVEVLSHDGPYLPVRSRIFAVVTWRDGRGRQGVIRAPAGQIERTM